jgi:hypothetical protein
MLTLRPLVLVVHWASTRALSAQLLREMHHPTGCKGHFLLGGAPNDLPVPIEGKHLFVKVFALAHGPGFAIDF